MWALHNEVMEKDSEIFSSFTLPSTLLRFEFEIKLNSI